MTIPKHLVFEVVLRQSNPVWITIDTTQSLQSSYRLSAFNGEKNPSLMHLTDCRRHSKVFTRALPQSLNSPSQDLILSPIKLLFFRSVKAQEPF